MEEMRTSEAEELIDNFPSMIQFPWGHIHHLQLLYIQSQRGSHFPWNRSRFNDELAHHIDIDDLS